MTLISGRIGRAFVRSNVGGGIAAEILGIALQLAMPSQTSTGALVPGGVALINATPFQIAEGTIVAGAVVITADTTLFTADSTIITADQV